MKILSAALEATAAGPEGFPGEGLAEIALLGRSNVGKSSLLNRLAGRRKLARTSGTPGKTRLIHFFRIVRPETPCLLVDLPGYGFARVSKQERAGWRRLVEGYLEGRGPLRGAILLQDVRRDPSDDERELLAWLAQRGIPALAALTKADKLKPRERVARLRRVAEGLGLPPERTVETSARTGAGIDRLWAAIDTLL